MIIDLFIGNPASQWKGCFENSARFGVTVPSYVSIVRGDSERLDSANSLRYPQVFNPDPIEVKFSTQRIDNLNENPLQWPQISIYIHICTYIRAYYILMCIHIYLYNLYVYIYIPYVQCITYAYEVCIEATLLRYTEALKRNLSLSSYFDWSTWGAEGSFWCKSRWLGWCGVFLWGKDVRIFFSIANGGKDGIMNMFIMLWYIDMTIVADFYIWCSLVRWLSDGIQGTPRVLNIKGHTLSFWEITIPLAD